MLRDYCSNIKCMFSSPLGRLGSNQAGLKALIKALQISKELVSNPQGNFGFIFETNSLNNLSWIKGRSSVGS